MPNPDGSVDVNLRSFYGPQDNGLVLDEAGTTQGYLYTKNIGMPYDAPLKFTSGVDGVQGSFGMVIAGKNGAADCNNKAKNLTLHAELWDISQSKYGFTNKGGCANNRFGGLVRGHGKECDFDQDNYSDQSHDPVTGTELNLKHENGDAIRVRYIYEKPKFAPGSGPYKFVFPQPWIPLPRRFIGFMFLFLRAIHFPGMR